MKILAIIPARAGSKGIPNKNIRLLNDHPMIYYTIHNAIASRYITDIIVSTDSPEIEIIAQQMRVRVNKRCADLCKDDTTLDAVVYNAVKDEDCDYVITMQPTSPTLKTQTLDTAIEYAIQKNLDTLISSVNAPHLAWIEKDGKKVPAYEKRLNRQFLPPYYLETGAFLISKKICITPETRIGTNTDIYEVPTQESLDIDTFEDLKYAATILEQKKVAIYVNGNNSRGMGHIYRALELADEFYVKPDIYYDINQTNPKLFGKTTHNITGINGIGELLTICEQNPYDIFINDILDTSIDYMIALRKVLPKAKIINFEDNGEGIYKADLAINALYEEKGLPQVRSGSQYFICSKLFMFYEPIQIKETVQNIFISFGGADPQNYSDRLLHLIQKEKYDPFHFTIVLGRAKNNIEELMKFNQKENMDVYYDISNMPELMSQCDIGITSRGRTSYELTMLGIPAIVMSQNSREEKHGFVNNQNGFFYLGLNPSDYMIETTLDMLIYSSFSERKNCQEVLLTHDLRHGRKRVLNLIHNL